VKKKEILGSIEDPEILGSGRCVRDRKKASSFTKSRRDEEEERVEAACSSLASLRLYVSL
jgi:hypothetical protein